MLVKGRFSLGVSPSPSPPLLRTCTYIANFRILQNLDFNIVYCPARNDSEGRGAFLESSYLINIIATYNHFLNPKVSSCSKFYDSIKPCVVEYDAPLEGCPLQYL